VSLPKCLSAPTVHAVNPKNYAPSGRFLVKIACPKGVVALTDLAHVSGRLRFAAIPTTVRWRAERQSNTETMALTINPLQ
jgi:hypothetical protein